MLLRFPISVLFLLLVSFQGKHLRYLLSILLSYVSEAISLNKYVDNFDILNYRPVISRRKREINADPTPVFLKFRSHNR